MPFSPAAMNIPKQHPHCRCKNGIPLLSSRWHGSLKLGCTLHLDPGLQLADARLAVAEFVAHGTRLLPQPRRCLLCLLELLCLRAPHGVSAGSPTGDWLAALSLGASMHIVWPRHRFHQEQNTQKLGLCRAVQHVGCRTRCKRLLPMRGAVQGGPLCRGGCANSVCAGAPTFASPCVRCCSSAADLATSSSCTRRQAPCDHASVMIEKQPVDSPAVRSCRDLRQQ